MSSYPVVMHENEEGSIIAYYRVELAEGVILLVQKDLADIDPTYLQRQVEEFRDSLHA